MANTPMSDLLKISQHNHRDARIIALYRCGITQKCIAEDVGVSTQRIDQILKSNSINRTDGGMAVRAKAKEAKKEQERNLKYTNKHGCNYLEYKRIAKLKDMNGKAPQYSFKISRFQATRREIKWEIKFYTWWAAWQKSGKWEEKGTKRGKYVMGRKDVNGPFSKDNIQIKTCSENNYRRVLCN